MVSRQQHGGLTQGVLLALGSLAILGVMPVVSNGRPEGFGALAFAFWLSVWQVFWAAPLVIIEWRRGRGLFAPGALAEASRRSLTVAVVTGALFGLSTYLYVLGMERAGAVNAAIAIQAYPLFAILWESLFLKRRKSPPELALTLVLVAALYGLGTGGTWRLDGVSPWFLVALGVPFLWSIAHVMIKEELARRPITPAQVTFLRVAISTAILGAVVAVGDPAGAVAVVGRTDFLVAAAVMGLVYTAELIVWFYAVRTIDVSLASAITTPWPVVTMVLAAIFLGEAVEGYQVATFAVVVTCLYGLIALSARRVRLQAARQ